VNKTALISGAGGQDASYLAEHLISSGYEVHGLERSRSASECRFVPQGVVWHKGDICDFSFIESLFCQVKPDLIFNLAAQSEVRLSCDIPHATTNVNALGALNMLESFKRCCPYARFFQACSSEMFGKNIDHDGYQRETTPMAPITPYGISKLYAYQMGKYYRNQFELFVSNGILFNHESPRRKEAFLTTKVVRTAVQISFGMANELKVGNLDVARDWGHSKDYTKAMIMMLEHDRPDDYVICSMESHTVEYLIRYVFSKLGLDFNKFVVQDPLFMRNIDQKIVRGDSTKAKTELQWKREYSFEAMLDEMMAFWIKELETKNV